MAKSTIAQTMDDMLDKLAKKRRAAQILATQIPEVLQQLQRRITTYNVTPSGNELKELLSATIGNLEGVAVIVFYEGVGYLSISDNRILHELKPPTKIGSEKPWNVRVYITTDLKIHVCMNNPSARGSDPE